MEIDIENIWKTAYEHGLEKAGWENNAVPMWDIELYNKTCVKEK